MIVTLCFATANPTKVTYSAEKAWFYKKATNFQWGAIFDDINTNDKLDDIFSREGADVAGKKKF